MINFYVPKSSDNFNHIFGENIAERQFALGGIFIPVSDDCYAKTVIYKNPYHTIDGENAISFGYLDISNEILAKQIFSILKDIAKQENCRNIIGPMNGSTWNSYRIMDSHSSPYFLSEEITNENLENYLIQNNFNFLKGYSSNIAESSFYSSEMIQKKEVELEENNWIIRSIDVENLAKELERIAVFSNQAFSNNFLYSPIKPKDFVSKYQSFIQVINPKYIKLIENENGDIQAVMLAFLNALSGNKELIIKTTARNSSSKIKGLGAYLSHKVTQMANQDGIEKVIHAYIAIDNNNSNIISGNLLQAKPYRKYSLYIHKI